MTTDIFYITFDMSFINLMIYRMQIKNNTLSLFPPLSESIWFFIDGEQLTVKPRNFL